MFKQPGILATDAKNRPGRPQRFSPEFVAIVKGLFPDLRPRALQDRMNAIWAVKFLKHDIPAYEWLLGPGGNDMKFTILTELGRLEDSDLIRQAATTLCRDRPKGRVAVQFLRRWRRGKASPGDHLDLAQAILRTIDDYERQHEGVTPKFILTSLASARVVIEREVVPE